MSDSKSDAGVSPVLSTAGLAAEPEKLPWKCQCGANSWRLTGVSIHGESGGVDVDADEYRCTVCGTLSAY